RSDRMTSELRQLASHAAAIELAALPTAVVDQGRRVMLDTIAATVAGNAEPELRALAADLAGGGRSSVLGTTACASSLMAAFLNAVAGCWHDLDEGNRYARVHAAVHVVPVALAVGQEIGASGAATLEAMIAGYEVAAR